MNERRALLAACLAAAALPACFAGSRPAGPEAAPPAPPPVVAVPPPAASAAMPPGDWVYTAQYGWVFMPEAAPYTWVPPGDTGEPLEFVFLPSFGWTWVSAPWVWGIGPWPHFGSRGPRPHAWYQHGWWRDRARWRYVPERGPITSPRDGVRAPPHRAGRRPEAPHRGAARAAAAPPETAPRGEERRDAPARAPIRAPRQGGDGRGPAPASGDR